MIVDASVAVKWIAREADSERAAELSEREVLGAPTLIFAEVGNAMWRKSRVGEAGPLGSLGSLSAVLDWTSDLAPLSEAALRLARELGHPIYDCFYLALALGRGEPLVTADDRFIAACALTPYAVRLLHLRDWA